MKGDQVEEKGSKIKVSMRAILNGLEKKRPFWAFLALVSFWVPDGLGETKLGGQETKHRKIWLGWVAISTICEAI